MEPIKEARTRIIVFEMSINFFRLYLVERGYRNSSQTKVQYALHITFIPIVKIFRQFSIRFLKVASLFAAIRAKIHLINY